MKKVFTLILTLTMVFSLSVPASAAPITSTGNGDVGEVKVNVIPGSSNTPPVYYVTVDWESLTFTYTKGAVTKNWNPEKHNYTTASGAGGWDKMSADIVVTNHSNVGIGVAMNFDGSGTTKTVHGVTATLTNHTFDLATGVDRTYENADKKSATVTVADTPNVSNEFTIGMVKIAISDE